METTLPDASGLVQELTSSLEEDEDLWDEATVDRELSLAPGDDSEDEDEVRRTPPMPSFELPSVDPASTSAPVPEAQLEVEEDRDDSADSGDESEPLDDGVIKITSDDPLAAARAAAILRLVRPSQSPLLLSRLSHMLTLPHSTTTTASRTSPRRRRGAGAPPSTPPPRCATPAAGHRSPRGSARPPRRHRMARGGRHWAACSGIKLSYPAVLR